PPLNPRSHEDKETVVENALTIYGSCDTFRQMRTFPSLHAVNNKGSTEYGLIQTKSLMEVPPKFLFENRTKYLERSSDEVWGGPPPPSPAFAAEARLAALKSHNVTQSLESHVTNSRSNG